MYYIRDKCLNMQLLEASQDHKISKGIRSIVNKSEFPYPSKGQIKIKGLSELLEDKLLLALVIREGLPYKLFEIIQKNTPFSDSNWANFLGISSKSIQRYKKESKTFKSLQTEKILEITEVCSLGIDIFEDINKFKLWLNTPNFAVGKIAPIELLGDSYGKELVMTELVRIDHGIFI